MRLLIWCVCVCVRHAVHANVATRGVHDIMCICNDCMTKQAGEKAKVSAMLFNLTRLGMLP